MIRRLQEAMVAEARLCFQRIHNATDPIDIAIKYAKYTQTRDIIRIVANTFYPRDKQSREALVEQHNKLIADMESSEIVGPFHDEKKGGSSE